MIHFLPLNACHLSPFSIRCYVVPAACQAVCWTLSAQEGIRCVPVLRDLWPGVLEAVGYGDTVIETNE